MATQVITDPILLDSTGQGIITALNNIKNVVQPTNVCDDIDTTIKVSDWSVSSPYTYTWMNNKVTSECAIKVNFLEGAESADTVYIECEKVTGGVRFTAPIKPTSSLPVRVHIINAEADSINAVTADLVATDAVHDASNVQEALENHEEDIGALNSKLLPFITGQQLSSTELTTPTSILSYPNGVYAIGSVNTANFPFSYGTAFKIGIANGYGMIIAKRALTNEFFIRHYNNTEWNDGNWFKFTGTEV